MKIPKTNYQKTVHDIATYQQFWNIEEFKKALNSGRSRFYTENYALN